MNEEQKPGVAIPEDEFFETLAYYSGYSAARLRQLYENGGTLGSLMFGLHTKGSA